MSIRTVELRVQTRLSAAFIAADAIEVQLLRRPAIADGAGGRAWGTAVPLGAQTFRLIPQEDGATARTNRDGESATPEYMLMGAPDVDMQRFDEFLIGTRRYQIVYIDNRQYEIKGEVLYLGG